jgi:hypothetical protein
LLSPPLWLALLSGGAIAVACGSSDTHRQSRSDEGGASGAAGALGAVDVPNLDAGGVAGAAPAAGGDGGAMPASGGAGGEAVAAGGAQEMVAGAGPGGGAGGATADGCLALHFGAETDTVQIPDVTIPDFGTAGTIEVWLLPDPAPTGGPLLGGVLFNKWVNFQEDKYLFVNDDGSVSVYFAQQAANFSSPAGLQPSTWQHLALVYDTTSARIYIDGAKVGEQLGAGPPVNSDGNIQLGHVNRDSQLRGLRGFYSEMRVSRVARYTANFTPAPHLTSDADAIGFWKLDEGAGNIASDSSTFDNPGTIDGAEWQLATCR